MNPLLRFVLPAALACGILASPRASAQDDPRALIDWLRVLAIETRLAYQFDDPPNARLFTDTVPDGRTVMDYIADSLGAAAGGDPDAPAVPNNWPLLDEASSLCLAEAEKMKALAIAAQGTPDEAKFNEGRRKFLEGAGRLLGFYKVAAGDTFDELAGAATDLADLFLPGDVELRKIGGAGRYNVETKEFAGRLSGEVGLPKFDALLVVPNLSFDSRGNLDLTAYGMATFPPAPDDGVTLTIPPRRPFHLHLGDDGSIRAAGTATLEFPGGNTVETYLDIDDPDYEFGFAFSGKLTIELAKEVTLVRPVVNFDAAAPLALDALAGFGQFYGSLGAGIEVFLGENPELPSLDEVNVGVPPEFDAPETVVPLDVWDAWVVSLANEHVRPTINGSIEGTLEPVREALDKLQADLVTARNQTGAELAQMKRLRRIAKLNGEIKRMLEDGAAVAMLGGDATAFQTRTVEAANEAVAIAKEYLENTPADADYKVGFAAVRLLLQAESVAALTGSDFGLDLDLTFTKLDQWETASLARFGFNLDGSIANQAVVDQLTHDDFSLLALVTFELEAMRQSLGGSGEALAEVFLRLAFERTRDSYNEAVSSSDLETRAVEAIRLIDLAAEHQAIGFQASEAEQLFMFMALQDTYEAIANRSGGGPTGEKLATSFLEAARNLMEVQNDRVFRRKAEMFGETERKPEFSETLDFSFYDYSFFEKVHRSAEALATAGLIDAAAQGRIEANFTSFLGFFRAAQAARLDDATLVTQNLEGAYDSLTLLLDGIGFIEDFLPTEAVLLDEFRTSWHALHVEWTPVAEARKAHWHLAAYLRELSVAAGRYGDGVGAALESAFAAAGSEAGAGLQRVVDSLAGLLDTVGTEEFQFALPGDAEVQRLFGQLAFNRITGAWSVGFGGKVAFPDINANFEIQSATLASNGDFALSILTDGPVPFGLLDAASLDIATAFDLDGNLLTPVINNASASGIFTIDPEVGPTASYTVGLDYSFLDPDHRFQVTAGFANPTELFTPELVLFSGGFGFNLQTNGGGQPTQLGAEVALNAGILLRPEAAGKPLAELSASDFFLHFDGQGGLDFSADDQTIALRIAAGTSLTLPQDLFSSATDESQPLVLTLASDACVQYALDTGALSFCDVNGQPVAIEVSNALLRIPGLEDLEVELHRATLILSGSDLPVLTNLDATLSIPLPDNAPARIAINDGEFRLDGFPTGTITLLDDATLFDADGFAFTLLGDGSGACPEPTSLSITRVEGGAFDGLPRVALNGAVRFSIPTDVLRLDTVGDNTIQAIACGGGFILEPGLDPRLTLDSLTIDGSGTDFLFTEVGGLRIGNPRLVLDEIDQLWSPDGSGVFSISLSGEIAVDGVGGFRLADATFRFPRGQLPDFSLAGVGFRVGDGMGLDINFPTRAGIVHDQGETFLEYGVIDIDFTEDSPIQFIGELNFSDNGQNRRLSLSHLTFEDLTTALALDPGDGVGVRIYDYLTAVWYGGEFTDAGIRDASFSLSSEELPLPDTRLTIPILSFRRGEPVRLAFYGDFDLKDLSPTPTKVRVPPTRPVWLEVSPSSLRLSGRVEVMMEGGTTLSGELLLDDPYYQIKIEAEGLTLPLVGGLADLLPVNPGSCLPAVDDDVQLDLAADCLKTYADAYANFTATVAGAAVTGADPNAVPPAEPPGPFSSAVSILEAWSWSALAPTAQAMPLQQLVDFFDFACDASAATQDAETVTRYLLALKRAKLAVQNGALDGSADERAALDQALADAEVALLARMQDPEAVASLQSLEQTLRMLVDIEGINQTLGESFDSSLLATHLPDLMDRGIHAYLASLGVRGGEFLPDANPIINEMNRFVAFSTLRDLLELMAEAAVLGVDGAITAPIYEGQIQLAHRFYALTQSAMNEARNRGDIRSFQYALEDLLDLESSRALGIFSDHPSLDLVPDLADLATFASQLADLFAADLARPYGDRSYRNQLLTLRGLLNILEEMPPQVTFTAEPFLRAFDRMSEALDEAVTTLVLNDRCDELALMVEAGLVHRRLAGRFELPLPYDWEGPGGYLEQIANRFATAAPSGKCWSQLHDAACLLIEESRLDALRDELPTRRAYLENATTLINAARSVAVSCWQDEETRRSANPALNLADVLLPGDVLIDRAAGSLRYNRRTGEFGGALSGMMRLPKFNAALTLNNASFSSGGAFDLNAFGQLSLPPGGEAALLEIPARRPLHLSFDPPNDFNLTGGAKLSLASGLELEAHLTIDDPTYCFGASLKGVRFDLANQMTVLVPELPDDAEVFPEVSGRILTRYFTALSGTLETLAPIGDLSALVIGDPGTPPEFVAPSLDDPLQPLELWTNSALADLERGIGNVYTDTTEVLREQIRLLALDLKELTKEARNLDAIATRNRALRRATEVLDRMGREAVLGGDPGHASWVELQLAIDEALAASRILMATPGNQQNLWRANRTARAVLDAAEADAIIGGNDPIVAELVDFYDTVLTNLLAQYGFDADGNQVDPSALDGLTREEIDDVMRSMLEALEVFLLLGGHPREEAVLSAIDTLLFTQRDVIVRSLRGLDPESYGERLKLAKAYLQVPATAESAGLTYPATGELLTGGQGGITVEADIQAAVDEIEGALEQQLQLERRLASNPGERFYRELVDALTKANRQLRLDLKNFLDQQVEERADQLEEFISQDWPAGRIRDGLGALEELIDLLAWMEAQNAPALPHFRDVVLPDLTVKFTAVAEAQRAWWLLGRYTELLYDASLQKITNDSTILKAAFESAASDTIRASKRLADALTLLLPGTRPVEIALPGDLLIESAYGEVCYNRETSLLKGTLGGRVSFPEADTYFEIVQLTIANDGSFAIDLTTGGAVPFGSSAQVNFNVPLASGSGDLQGNFVFTGAGSLEFLDPADPQNGTTVNVNLDYSTATGLIEFTGGISNLEILEDLVVLNGNLAAQISTANPNGSIVIGGGPGGTRVGLLARQKPIANAPPTEEDFYLTLGIEPTTFTYSPTDLTATFTGGSLTLPPDIFSKTTNGELNGDPATVALAGNLCIAYTFADSTLSFCDDAGQPFRLSFNDIGFEVPGLPGSLIVIDDTELLLTGSELPTLTNLDATFAFPMPGTDYAAPETNRTVAVNLAAEDWRLDGLPVAGSILLAEPVRVLDFDGFDLDVLAGTGMTFTYDDGADEMRFELLGAMRGAFDPNLLWDAGEGAGAALTGSGSFSWVVGQLPSFSIDTVALEGNFRLGGENGIGIKGVSTSNSQFAVIELLDLQNLFVRTTSNPFRIRLEGAMDIANFIEFGLEDTSFIWDGTTDGVTPAANNLIPRFEPGGFYGSAGENAIELASGFLPLYPTLIGLRFKNPGLPLFPEAGQMGLFDPANVIAIVSGVIALPNGAAVEAGSPGFSGSVDLLEIAFVFDQQLGFYVPDLENIDLNGFCIQLSNLDIPPLGGITGGICIGNLNALTDIPPHPEDVYFAGNVGAKVNDIGASVLFAAKPLEFIGACFELNAGPAGIPLDGGTLGGILLTGGRGGINFKNQFADPCDFATYIEAGSSIPEPGSPERPANPEEPPAELIPSDFAGGPLSCVAAPFPPRSVNPLCEEFPPDSGRFIFKGTRLTEADLNGAGITRSSIVGLSVEEIVNQFIGGTIGFVQDELQDAVLGATDAATPLEAVEWFINLADGIFQSFDDAATSVLLQAIRSGLKIDPEQDIYDILVTKAAEGIPCFDVTLLLGGTLSHTAISSVLTGSGNVTLSTTGTAVFDGSINLIGLPVATATLAVSLTNDQGMIDPAFGGVAKVALGPLELGDLSAAISCQGCFTAVANEFLNLLACQGAALGPEAAEFAYQLMENTFPDEAFDRATTLADHFVTFDTQEQLAYVSSFFNYLQLVVNGDPVPVQVDPAALGNFRDCFVDFIVALFPQVNPFICFSGASSPTLFGFPLTGGAETLLGASLVYGRTEDNGEEFQELIASAEFSPTFMMLYPILGGGATSFPLVDSATMGYSLRIPAFTKETTELLLTDPIQFATEQFTTFINDAVLAFSYGLSPLGIDLASGQGRMIMPRLESHPENPNRTLPAPTGVNPATWDPAARWGGLRYGSELDAFIRQERDAGRPVKLPTRTELILAALSKGQLKNPRWRGTHADLGRLFTDPAIPLAADADPDDPFAVGYTSSNATCDQLTGEVAVALQFADPGLTELSKRSLPNDYFPHGGLIGGAELAFPNVLANELPGTQLARLFAVPTTVEEFTNEWLPNAQRLFADPNDADPMPGEPGFAYFTGTNCVGQMALYLPAPNPVVPDPDNPGQFNVIDFQEASLIDMVSSLQAVDFQSIVNGADAFFPDEEILLTGWLDAPILGMPVARGSMDYDNNTQVFNLQAEIPSGTWLADWVGAEMAFEIKPPEYQLANLTPEGAAGKLQAIGESLATAALGNTQQIIDEIATTLPKVSATASMNLTIPPEVQPYLNTAASSNLELFAFSPAYEPGFLPGDNSPYAVARRRGGIGITGDFQVGYFPQAGEPIVIDIESASFAVLPSNLPTTTPALAGSVRVKDLSFDPRLPRFTDGELSFATEPDDLAPYLTLAGHLEPFKFLLPGSNLDLLTFDSLTPGGTVGATLSILRDDSIPGTRTGTSLEVDPMSASMPFLGPNVAITVYGDEPSPGAYTPFSFATTAGAEWEATVCLSAPGRPSLPPTFQICDPYDPAGPCLLEFTPNAPVCGTLKGVGLSAFQLALQLPAGFTATFYPNTDAEVKQVIGGTGFYSLYIDSNGRFFVDLGTNNNLDLPGAITAGGLLEFGYNPDGSSPNVRAVPSALAFASTDLADTRTASLSIRNDGTASANIVLNTNPRAEFVASLGGFKLPPGTSRTVDIVFSPKAVGARNGSLVIESNDPDSPSITVPISGTGTSSPRFFKSRDNLVFGPTLLNGTAKATVTIGNNGSAPMQVTGITVPNARFAISPNGPTTIQPGDSRTYLVSFTPTSLPLTSAGITFSTATAGSHQIFVSGEGSESRWVKLLDSSIAGNSSTLNDILMFNDARRGFVVGDAGTVLETDNGGRSWIPRDITSYDLKALAMRNMINNPVIAEYHFEEPPGSRFFRDESPNTYHGSTPSVGGTPQVGYLHGKVGSGLSFDNLNDSVDLATFDLPSSWTIAMWINPATTNDGQAFLGKNTANGNNQFIFGFYNDGYHVRFNESQTFTGGTKQIGWQHLVLSGSYNRNLDATTVQLYRDGIVQWRTPPVFTGAAFPMDNGRAWSIGQEWDGGGRSDFFGGQLDELYFFTGVLTEGERDYLRAATDAANQRIVMAGSDGMAFQSLTNGRAWTQLADQNVLGWRGRFGLYRDYDYEAVAIAENGKVILGGSSNGNRLVLVEDLYAGNNNDPRFPEDDEFDEVVFDGGAGAGSGETITALAENDDVYAVSVAGRVFRADTPTSTFFRQGSFDHTSTLRGMVAYSPLDIVAVGGLGAIARAENNANPGLVASGTSQTLWDIAYNPFLSTEMHVVGTGGTYLTSDNNGLNWNVAADGLAGHMRGVDAKGSGGAHEVWAVGLDHLIQYRPGSTPSGPFLTCYPGELDFGFLLTGQTRTLPIQVTNSGRSDLVISQVAVSGGPFTIAQTSLGAIPPGRNVTLFVRYKPTAASSLDAGALTFTTNEGGEPLRVRLRGRASGLNWQPVNLGVQGEVLDLVFSNEVRGYALVDPGAGQNSRVYYTNDGGVSWLGPLNLGNFGTNRVRLTGMDWSVSHSQFGYLSGHLEDRTGAFLQGIVLKTENSGGAWSSGFGPNDVGERGLVGIDLPLSDIKVSEVDPNVVVTCNSSPSGQGDFWHTTDGGRTWFNKQLSPSDNFDGMVVGHVANTVAGNDNSWVYASSGSRLYGKRWQNNWIRLSTNGQTVDFPSKVFNQNQIIRDFSFYDDPALNRLPDYGWIVGDRGLFWQYASDGPFGANWYPAADAEVFGTTNLARVHFHSRTNGWVVGESRIFDSSDGGLSWDVNFDAGEAADLRALDSFDNSRAWAGGSLGGQAVVWRYRSKEAPDSGLVSIDDMVLFPSTTPGSTTSRRITITNPGNTTLDVQKVSIESKDPRQRWTLGSRPSAVAAGGNSFIDVRFDASPEEIDVGALDPEVFLRFEDERSATTYLDCTSHRRDGQAASAPDQRPRIFQAGNQRDFCLQVDGNDYADVAVIDALGPQYSFSLWIHPDLPNSGQAFFGRHSLGGGTNYILAGYYNNGYYFAINNNTYSFPAPLKRGWQHLVYTCREIGTTTEVTCHRDGEILFTHVHPVVTSDAAGQPWILGADRDAGGINDFFTGCIDDFAIFNRLLTADEIQALGNKSPVVGVHEAELVINTDSEAGKYTVDLRAEVLPSTRMVSFQTDPPGLPLTIDGVAFPRSPVSFGVGNLAGQREWCEGSLHTVEAPEKVIVTADGGAELTYVFNGWDVASGRKLTVQASTVTPSYTARYVIAGVTDPNSPPPAPAQAPPPARGVTGFNISQALAGTPKGPFIRLSDGSLSVPALGNSFTMEGELFLSLTKMTASLSTSALSFPASGTPKWMELGAGGWLLDWEDNSHFVLKTHPPSLSLLGIDVVPDGQFCLELNENNNFYRAVFDLNEPFAPLPHLFEIKPGGVSLQYAGGSAFTLRMDGGMRVLDLPPVVGVPDWAIDENFDFILTSPNINLSLATLFQRGGVPVPADFFDSGCFVLDWGDIRIDNNPSWSLSVNNLSLSVFGQTVSTVSGTAGADGTLSMTGTLPDNLNVPLLPGSAFSVQKRNGGSASYSLDYRTSPSPRLAINFPGMRLQSSVGTFPSGGLNVPGISFDTSGSFDTGKISLPDFTFEGLALTKPEDGDLNDNYIRLRRNSAGNIYFDARAEIDPFADVPVIPFCSLHDFSLTIANTSVTASLRGNFCVFPDPISLEYNSTGNCEFQGGNDDFTIFLGTSCGGYRNEATGFCLGDCTP